MSAAATLATLLGSHLNAVPSFGKSQSANAEDEAESQPVRPAAVLVPVLPRGNDVTLLFTQRAPDLAYHASQVSFPGGQVETTDTDYITTALRELREEIGIESHFVNIAGALNTYQTGTGFQVVPIVGVIDDGYRLRVDPSEVQAIFEIPLSYLLDASRYERRPWIDQGVTRHFHAIEFPPYLIWGATAAMLVDLRRRVTETNGNFEKIASMYKEKLRFPEK